MKKIITLIMICTLFIGNFNTIYAHPVTNAEEQSISETQSKSTDETSEDTVEDSIDDISKPDPTFYSPWSESYPIINSEAGIVIEAETGSILYGKNIHDVYYPASITKILTTLIALENSSMNEIVTFSHDAIFNVELASSRIGIDVGEELTMEQALYGIMLASGNEVSYGVAEHIAGDIPSFSEMMNEKAKSLGATGSNFVNPHGLPDPNHYTTPHDMALISKAAMGNEDFREITKTRAYTIPPTNIQEESRYLANSHKFIRNEIPYEGAIGGKTGWTTLSEYTLVTFAERDGMTLISVIMKCPTIQDEYQDTINLLDFSFDNFNLYNIDNTNTNIEEDMELFTKYPSFFNTSNSPLKVNENGRVVLPNNIKINDTDKTIELVPLEILVNGENKIGSIVYSYNDTPLGSTDIIFNNTNSKTLLNNLYIDPAEVTPEDLAGSSSDELEEKESSNKSYIPIVIGVVVFLVICLILIYYFSPKQRRIRKRKRKNRFN